MADRTFEKGLYHLNDGATRLEGYFVVDAAGAVTSTKIRGVDSIAHNSTGDYTINLSDPYYGFLGIQIAIELLTPIGIRYQVKSVDVQSQDTPVVNVLFTNNDSPAALVDPASTRLWVELRLDNASY